MLLRDIVEGLDCRVCVAPEGWRERGVANVAAGDLMSEVLVNDGDQSLLITALNSEQVIRTGDIVDASAVLLVNGKHPQERVAELANECGIAVFSTPHSMYIACAMIHQLENGG